MIQHPSHYLHCRPIIFILKGPHHLLVETEYFRYHGRINIKLAGQIDISMFERIEQQRIYLITG
jgi:hypothetical protein